MPKQNMAKFAVILMAAALATAYAIAEGTKTEKTQPSATEAGVAVTTTAVVDQPAPNFTLQSSDGKTVSLADYKGKMVVLEWVNFDCPFVKKFYESGTMQKLQATYAKQGIVWLSICSSAPEKQGHFAGEMLKSRLTESKLASTAYLIDANGAVGKLYGAKTTPHMFVIDPKGTLVYAGAIDSKRSTNSEDIATAENYVVSAVTAVSSNKPVGTKTSTPYGCSVKYAE